MEQKNAASSRRASVQKIFIRPPPLSRRSEAKADRIWETGSFALLLLGRPGHLHVNVFERMAAARQFAHDPAAFHHQRENRRAQVISVARCQRAALEFAFTWRYVELFDSRHLRQGFTQFVRWRGDFSD